MRHLLLTVTILAASVSAMGQWDSWSSVGSHADQLKRASQELADRTSQEILRGFNKSRSDIEQAFIAQQINGAASLFLDMTRSRRAVGELRDAAAVLTELTRRAPSFTLQMGYWRGVITAVDNINRDLANFTGGGGWSPRPEPPLRPINGRVYWRGRVDDRVQISIRYNYIDVRTISGTNFGQGTFNFTSPLPDRNVEVSVDRKKGRGQVTVLQQPSRANNYTAIVEIFDGGSGAKDYDLDIFWR